MHTNEEKKRLLKKNTPPSPIFADSVKAFFFGGFLCAIAQVLYILILNTGLDEKNASFTVSCIFIFMTAVLTGIGVFDRIAKLFGAGTLVPVTGFSNAVTSQAIDAVGEGYILGVGSKIFSVAGPVIIYGMLCGTLYGAVYYIYLLFVR